MTAGGLPNGFRLPPRHYLELLGLGRIPRRTPWLELVIEFVVRIRIPLCPPIYPNEIVVITVVACSLLLAMFTVGNATLGL